MRIKWSEWHSDVTSKYDYNDRQNIKSIRLVNDNTIIVTWEHGRKDIYTFNQGKWSPLK